MPSHLDASYDEYFLAIPTGPGTFNVVDVSGNPIAQAPEYTASAGIDYSVEVSGVLER